LTASRAVAPIANTPWARIRTAGERLPAQRLDDPDADLLAPIRANGPTGMSPPELVGLPCQPRGSPRPCAAHAVA